MPRPAKSKAAPTVGPTGGVALEEAGSQKQEQRAPRAPSLLMVHPKRWQVLEGLVVPLCGDLRLAHSVNSVRQMGGKWSTKKARAQQEEAGWQIIEPRHGPLDDGKGGRTYTRCVHPPTDRDHGWYCYAWEIVPGGRVDLARTDTKGFATWLRGLVDTGVIPAPDPVVLEALQNKYLRDGGQYRAMAEKQPQYRADAERCERAAEVVGREVARLLAAAPDVGVASAPLESEEE
jgi:hypothetical protein